MSEPRPCRLRFVHCWPKHRACCGAAAVEFALVFPVFFMLFYAISAYGLIFTLNQSLTLAAAEGARAAVQDAPTEAARCTQAKTRANKVLSWLPAGPAAGITVTSTAAACGAARCVTVVVNYDYAGHPFVPALPKLGIAIPAKLSATATVQL